MMRLHWICFTLICFGLVRAASAGSVRADVGHGPYLALANQSKYASVGRIETFTQGGAPESGVIASGTLIAPDIVLTAAHTLSNVSSLKFIIGENTYSATSWTPNPSWTGDLYAGYDLGLVKLDSPVGGINPAIRYTGDTEVGQLATVVGYGVLGNGLTGASRYDERKRAGTNIIDSAAAGVGDSGRLLWTDFDNPSAATRDISSIPTALEFPHRARR